MEIVKCNSYDEIISFGIIEDKKKDTMKIALLGNNNNTDVTKDQFKGIIFCCKENLKKGK